MRVVATGALASGPYFTPASDPMDHTNLAAFALAAMSGLLPGRVVMRPLSGEVEAQALVNDPINYATVWVRSDGDGSDWALCN
jgi:hypothetical protein